MKQGRLWTSLIHFPCTLLVQVHFDPLFLWHQTYNLNKFCENLRHGDL